MADFLLSKQLLKISNNLTTSDVTNLKFLCSDLLPKRVLEEVKTGSDLFSALRGRNHISRDNLDFLEALLEAVHKVHLLQQLRNVLADPASAVEEDEEEDRSPSPPASSLSSLKFSTFLISVGDELPQRDLKNVTYFFQNYNVTGLTAQEVQSIREPAKLFDILMKEKIISPTNVRKLWVVMDAIGRRDICEKIDMYARSVPGCVGEGSRGSRGGGRGQDGSGRIGDGRREAGGRGVRVPEWELGGGRKTTPGWNDAEKHREREEAAVKSKLSQLPSLDPSSDDSMSDSNYSFGSNRLMMNSPPSHPSHGPKTAHKDNPLTPHIGTAVAEEGDTTQSRAVMLVGTNKVPVQDRPRMEESMEYATQSVTHSGPREMAGHGLQRRQQTHTQLLQVQLNEKIHQLQLQLEHERAHHRILADQRQQNNGDLARELERKGHEISDLRKEIDSLQKQLLTGNDSEMYQMNEYSPHGKAIVIVNDHFTPNPTDPSINLFPRPGAEHDMLLFKTTFEFLGYEVECHRNLTCEGMNQVLQKAAGENHEAHDSFVCCISSHGDEKVIYGTDSVGALRSDLVQFVKGCKSLCGKPKMFFLQACRTKASLTAIGAGLTYLPDAAEQDADVFIANASTVNYASYRDHERGSWFVMALHHIFTRHGQILTLAEMMYKVNNLVCTAQGIVQDEDSHTSGAVVQREARQCAETTSSFRMGLRFKFNTQ